MVSDSKVGTNWHCLISWIAHSGFFNASSLISWIAHCGFFNASSWVARYLYGWVVILVNLSSYQLSIWMCFSPNYKRCNIFSSNSSLMVVKEYWHLESSFSISSSFSSNTNIYLGFAYWSLLILPYSPSSNIFPWLYFKISGELSLIPIWWGNNNDMVCPSHQHGASIETLFFL